MKNLNLMLAIAAGLILLWVLATITRFLASTLLNLLVAVAIVLLVVWAIRRPD